MLQLGGEWFTTQFHEFVEFANTAPAMVKYVYRRLDIDAHTYHRGGPHNQLTSH